MHSNNVDPIRQKAEDAFNEGLRLLEQEREAEAGHLFFESIEIDPAYADGYIYLGNILLRKRDWKQAETFYRKAFQLADPEIKDILGDRHCKIKESRPYMEAMVGFGYAAWKQGRPDEAICIFRRLLILDSNDNLRIGQLMGTLYYQIGNLREALKWYKKNSGDYFNMYHYGLALVRQNRLEKAARVLIFAVFINPFIAAVLLDNNLSISKWWHGLSQGKPEYYLKYTNEFSDWWKKEELPLIFLGEVCNSAEVQQNLKRFFITRAAMRTAQCSEDADRLRKEGDSLCTLEVIKMLASNIYRQFEQGRSRNSLSQLYNV